MHATATTHGHRPPRSTAAASETMAPRTRTTNNGSVRADAKYTSRSTATTTAADAATPSPTDPLRRRTTTATSSAVTPRSSGLTMPATSSGSSPVTQPMPASTSGNSGGKWDRGGDPGGAVNPWPSSRLRAVPT